jgi:hypothetical protein
MTNVFGICEVLKMPQIHFYIPEKTAQMLRSRAGAAGLPISRYVAGVIQRELGGDWPEGFFERIVGGWQGKPLRRPPRGRFEKRDRLN